MPEPSLALISDMHLAPDGAGAERAQSGQDHPARRAAHLSAALQQVLMTKPAAVLFGGDNANQPVSRRAYAEAALTGMDGFPRPWHAIPGNHDVGATVGWPSHDPHTMAEALSAFTRTFGPDHWIVEAAGFRIIAANSQILGSSLPEARQQEQWLADQLATATDLLRVVFIHTPPYLRSPDDNFSDGSEQMCLRPAARQPLLDILNRTPPDLVITGHCHRFWSCPQPRWDWLGLPATALGQDEMSAVPSHHLPPGEDAVAWVAISRHEKGWVAVRHEVSASCPTTTL